LHSVVLVDCAKKGYFDLFVWLIENKNKVIIINYVHQILMVLVGIQYDHGPSTMRECHVLLIDCAIKTKQSNIVEWLTKNGCECIWKSLCSCGWDKCVNLQYPRYQKDDIIWFLSMIEKFSINDGYPLP
jgi:hypothetical protein